MASPLTHHAILTLNSGDVDLHPLVQVLDVRQIGTGHSTQERYRLVLSDGIFVQQAMLATQLNEFVKSGQVQKGSIVKLLEYICNTVQNRKIIIVLNMEVSVSVAEIIGDPKQVIMNEESLAAAMASAKNGQQQQQSNLQATAQQLPLPKPQVGLGIQAKENIVPPYNPPVSKPPQSVGLQPQVQGLGAGTHAQGGYQGPNSMQPSVSTIRPNSPMNTYGRPLMASPYQPAPVYSNRGAVVKNEAPARIIPIGALNPYQGRWTIKARVTAKGDLHRYHNPKGEGKVFHFDLLDAEGGEIRVTCFNNVADQFYSRVDLGKVYTVSKGQLKPAQKNFNHLKNEWEIHLESSSVVDPCFEEDGSIPHQQFDFKPISEIENTEVGAVVDLMGIVVTINPSTTIMRKNGTETQKRSVQLRDASSRSVELTMWGTFCNVEGQELQGLCDSGQSPVLAVKSARVSDFNGKNVGTISSSRLLVNPNLPQCVDLREWFERVGKATPFLSLSKEGGNTTRTDIRKTVSQIKDEGLGRSEKPDWILLKATVSFIKHDVFCYTACPLLVGDRQCNKKVINNGDGTWRCDRCDKSVAECDYRYLLSIQVQDHTGVTWVTAFQEAGEEIMGVSAKELYMWKQDDNVKFSELLQKLLFTRHLLKLKVKEENYNDELRVKSTVVKTERLDFAMESRFLIDVIGKLAKGELLSGPSTMTTPLSMGSELMGNNLGTGYGGVNHSGVAASNLGAGYAAGNLNNNYGGYANGNMSNYGGGISCFKCGGAHFARECPNERAVGQTGLDSGRMGAGPNICFKCGQAGHWANDCPSQSNGGYSRPPSYGGYAGNLGNGRGY